MTKVSDFEAYNAEFDVRLAAHQAEHPDEPFMSIGDIPMDAVTLLGGAAKATEVYSQLDKQRRTQQEALRDRGLHSLTGFVR